MRQLLRRIKNKLRRIFRPTQTNAILQEEVKPNYDAPHLVEGINSLIKRRVNTIDFNGAYFTISGTAFFEKFPEKDEEKIIKSLVLLKTGLMISKFPQINPVTTRAFQ